MNIKKRLMAARGSGFTLIELLVVIAVILVLMSLMLPMVKAFKDKERMLLASRQVKDIYAASMLYYQALNTYPPDRQDYGTGKPTETGAFFDSSTIYKYLGAPITKKGTGGISIGTYGPFMVVPDSSLKPDPGNGGARTLMCDPWNKPYEFDAMHIVVAPPSDPNAGKVTRNGEPYSAAFLGTLNPNIRWDVKVWSGGPDGKWSLGSNTPLGIDRSATNLPTDPDADNITSWAD